MRVVAVDPGLARVGLAVSDESETLATPLRVIRGGSGVARRIADAAAGEGAARIVVGLAVRLDGSEGDEAAAARRLASQLREATGLPVELWDERYTSDLAGRLLRSARPKGDGRKARAAGHPRRRVEDDAVAAAVLLQSYLDRSTEAMP